MKEQILEEVHKVTSSTCSNNYSKLKKKIDYSEKYRFYDKNLPRFPKPIANPRSNHY